MSDTPKKKQDWYDEKITQFGPLRIRLLKLEKNGVWCVSCEQAGISGASLGTKDLREAQSKAYIHVAHELIKYTDRLLLNAQVLVM